MTGASSVSWPRLGFPLPSGQPGRHRRRLPPGAWEPPRRADHPGPQSRAHPTGATRRAYRIASWSSWRNAGGCVHVASLSSSPGAVGRHPRADGNGPSRKARTAVEPSVACGPREDHLATQPGPLRSRRHSAHFAACRLQWWKAGACCLIAGQACSRLPSKLTGDVNSVHALSDGPALAGSTARPGAAAGRWRVAAVTRWMALAPRTFRPPSGSTCRVV
jgi:hypothetical protein